MATILIADEDVAVRDVLSMGIAGEGHDVVEVSDGQEAIEVALQQQPDMIFLAAGLPVFNGYEVCEQLREDPEVPSTIPIVLLLTMDMDPHMRDRVGASACVSKNISTSELRDLLVEHLGPKANPR